MRQRPQYLLQAFAALGHPVFFVDPREPALREADGVHIVPALDAVPGRSPILYVHFAPLRHLFDSFEDPVVVYDLLDDLSIYDADEDGMPEERRVRFHHPRVMERADVVMVSNPVLADTHRAERADLVLVPNGVDAGRFGAPAAPPSDLSGDGRPVVGYHGMVSYWFDVDLLAAVATARPGYRFVLVGPVDPRVAERVAPLRALPNVELLGERPSSLMPSYVQAFDVGTVWFQVNDLTRAVTPLKMYEYLAAGVPCVATPLPACVDEPAVTTAATPDEFAAALDRALASAHAAALRETARRHDWTALLRPVVDRLGALGLDRVR
jgi:glycosyltransferase involved in cell wall biosynthesis